MRGAVTTSASIPSTRYQSSVSPHFPMKTMLTPRGPMASSSSKPTIATHNLLDANGSMAAAFAASTAPGSSNSTTVVCKVPKFLRSLYAILQTEDPSVINWVQNQELKPNRVTAFHILDMTRFEQTILPKYFKHQKFASFQRQLNNFGFRKWTKTQSSGVCTFSHNSFPPDPNHTGVMRASIREQWRQKSTLTTCSSSSSLSSGLSSTSSSTSSAPVQPPRRRVGNGITKADRKNNRRQVNVQIPQTESFMELYKSPLNSVLAMESNHHRQQQTQYHQPTMKKLARPLQELNGLEAFCDDTYKQFILPPLQPHHLLSSTPRGLYSLSLNEAEPTTPNLGGFPHAHSSRNPATEYNLKYDYPEKHHNGHSQHQQGHHSMEASFNGAFLEPWSWDASMNSALELGTFPLDFDWQDANNMANNHGNNGGHHSASVSVSVGIAPQHHQQQQHYNNNSNKEAFVHQQHQDRAMTSAEEFGLETFLFAE